MNQLFGFVLQLILLLIRLLQLAIIVRVILSWVAPGARSWWLDQFRRFTEPMFARLRQFIPLVGGMDFTPLVAYLILQGLGIVVHNLQYQALYGF